jgi:Zn-dependent protease
MMHAYVAYRLGDDLAHSRGRISLNPLVHIDPVLTIALPAVLLLLGQPPILAAKPVPINTSRIDGDEYGLALVGVSGPLTNLALAFLGGFLFGLLEPTGILFEVLKLFVQINVGLFVFNMLPLPPLDGSRLLYAVAPEGLRNVMRQIEGFGIFGLILILWFILPIISPVLSTVNDYILNLVV